MKRLPMIIGMMLATEMTVAVARAVPPPEPLERALAGADLVVVGKLGKFAPVEGTRQATGEIAVTQTLKGPAEVKAVTLLTAAPGQQGDPRPHPVGPRPLPEGTEGIWILKGHVAEGGKLRCNDLQPMTALDEVKRILKERGMLTQPSDAPGGTARAKPSVGRVVGLAFNYHTGRPSVGAEIRAFPYDHPDQVVLGRAAADGTFSIEVAPCTNLFVEAMTAGNWRGEVFNVTVVAGRETNVGRIAIRNIPVLRPPEDPQ